MNKKRKIILLSFVVVGISICIGLYLNSRIEANKKYEAIQSIAIQLTPVLKHENDKGSLYEIQSDGQVTHKYSTYNEKNEYEIIEEKIKLSPDEYKKIIKVLKHDKILEKPEKLTRDMDILDGGYYSLSIKTKDRVFLLEGTNPKDKDFHHSLAAILKIVQDMK